MSGRNVLHCSTALCAMILTATGAAQAQQAPESPAASTPAAVPATPAPAPSDTAAPAAAPAPLPPVVVEKPPERRVATKPKPIANAEPRAATRARAAPVARQPTNPQPQNPQPTSNGAGPFTSAQTSGTPFYAVPDATTATKTNTPLMQTPATVTVVPQQVLIDQAVTTLQEATRNAPGVTVGGGASNDSGQPYSALYIRGFPATTFLRNGYRSLGDDDGVFSTQFVNIDQVQVLQGPAAILYGTIEPGGAVNIITKQPLSTPYYAVEQQIGSYGDYRTAFDLTGPASPDGKLTYRLSGSWQDQGSPTNYIFNNTNFLAPVLKYSPDASTTVTLEAELKNLSFGQNFGFFPYINGVPVSNNIATNYSSRSPEVQNSFLEALTWQHTFDNGWTVRQNFTAALDNTTAAGIVPSYISDGQPTVSGQGVGRFTNQLDNSDSHLSTTLDVTGKVNTGPIAHTLLFGGDYNWYHALNNIQQAGLLDSNISWVDLFAPNASPATPFMPGVSPLLNGWVTTNFVGVYAQDQMTLPYNLHLLVGARYNFENQTSSTTFAGLSPQDAPAINEGVVTPRVGLLWQPLPWNSIYGSYSQSFSPNYVGYLQANGQAVPPSQGWQWEFGDKMSFFNDKLIASVAWYDLTKTNIPTPDLANPDFVTVIGQARSIGWEFALQGQVAPGWNVIGNLALTHATVTQSNDSNNPVGAPLGNVPEVLLNLWTTYEWQEGALRGLKVGGGMTYSSPVPYLNGGNSGLYTNPYTIFSAMASYSFNFHGVKWTAQINGYNLFNLKYFQEIQAGGANYTVLSSPPNVTYTANNVVWGMPRTILASLKAEF